MTRHEIIAAYARGPKEMAVLHWFRRKDEAGMPAYAMKATIAEEADCSPALVQKLIVRLGKDGAYETERRDGRLIRRILWGKLVEAVRTSGAVTQPVTEVVTGTVTGPPPVTAPVTGPVTAPVTDTIGDVLDVRDVRYERDDDRFAPTKPQRPYKPGEDEPLPDVVDQVSRALRYHHPKIIPSAGPDAYTLLTELRALEEREPGAVEEFRFWRPWTGARNPFGVLLTDIRKRLKPSAVMEDRARLWVMFGRAPLAWQRQWYALIEPQPEVAVLDAGWTEADLQDAISEDNERRRSAERGNPAPVREAESDEAESARARQMVEELRARIARPAPKYPGERGGA